MIHAAAQDALSERSAVCAHIEDAAAEAARTGYSSVASMLFVLATDIRRGKHHKGDS
jgi:hypothetical protein